MRQSDKVVGMTHFKAINYIESLDLWNEVVDLEVDHRGVVVRVIH